MTTAIAGFLLGAGLIVAIGAQNVFVLRQGIRGEHVGLVVLVCVVSDAVLITVGIAGVGAVLQDHPWAVDVARFGGAAFLLTYAALAARRVWMPAESGDVLPPPRERTGSLATRTAPAAPVVATALALTWLNPHVYLDTVFLLGSVAATHGPDRWVFGGGAIAASTVWFLVLGHGSRRLGRFFATPTAWRLLDGFVAVSMLALGLGLLLAG